MLKQNTKICFLFPILVVRTTVFEAELVFLEPPLVSCTTRGWPALDVKDGHGQKSPNEKKQKTYH